MNTRPLLALAAAMLTASPMVAQFQLPKPIPLNEHKHTKDAIYHRKHGTALTMEVLEPLKNRNGAGVIVCVSANYLSNESLLEMFHKYVAGEFLNRGYVVFLVRHGSQPTFTVPEIVDDMHRAVRFIKANAKEYKVDPNK